MTETVGFHETRTITRPRAAGWRKNVLAELRLILDEAKIRRSVWHRAGCGMYVNDTDPECADCVVRLTPKEARSFDTAAKTLNIPMD